MLKATKANHKWAITSLFCIILATAVLVSWRLTLWAGMVTLAVLLITSWLALLTKTDENSTLTPTSNAADRFLSRNRERSLGLKLQGMGQLNLALGKFKQCAHNHDSANLLYNLAIDFQIKGEPDNAKRVLLYISTFEPNFKDIKARLQTFEADPLIDDDQASQEQPNLITEDQSEAKPSTEAIREKIITPVDNFESTSVTSYNEVAVADNKLRGYPQLYGNRYKAIKRLGKGTTGAVFKGKDIAANKLVAIKVLNLTDELDPDQLDEYKFRFHREVDTAENLNHPNIVKIYDSGETEGFAYIAMEYVEGYNLRAHARTDRLLHPKNILKLIAQCADALAYAHKQDVIHRDIKPANILYNQTDGYVKLTDFGIARIPDSTRTRTGSILGTPLYMSPEQLAGEKLDARSDLYSLGVTLYHLLTGSPPFRPKTMAELLRLITHERHKDITEINPNTPSCITWTVNRALEKDPDKRFQSAASMANKLRECQMMLDG